MVTDLLRRWQYAVPLVVNLTGSVWFFVVVGKAGKILFCWGGGGGGFLFGGVDGSER